MIISFSLLYMKRWKPAHEIDGSRKWVCTLSFMIVGMQSYKKLQENRRHAWVLLRISVLLVYGMQFDMFDSLSSESYPLVSYYFDGTSISSIVIHMYYAFYETDHMQILISVPDRFKI